jgi:hypothetical protein
MNIDFKENVIPSDNDLFELYHNIGWVLRQATFMGVLLLCNIKNKLRRC